MKTVFLIKPYSAHISPAPNEKVHDIFKINEQEYAIVETILEWGKPQIAQTIEQEDSYGFYLYNSYKDAKYFADLVRRYNR